MLNVVLTSFFFFIILELFQCRGVLLLWHMVGQGPAVLAAGAGRVGYFLFHLVYSVFLFNGRQLDILIYCGLGRCNPAVVVSYYRRRAR